MMRTASSMGISARCFPRSSEILKKPCPFSNTVGTGNRPAHHSIMRASLYRSSVVPCFSIQVTPSSLRTRMTFASDQPMRIGTTVVFTGLNYFDLSIRFVMLPRVLRSHIYAAYIHATNPFVLFVRGEDRIGPFFASGTRPIYGLFVNIRSIQIQRQDAFLGPDNRHTHNLRVLLGTSTRA